MNTIKRIDETHFVITTETGAEIKATLIHEKKTGEDHIKLPVPNETGRQFIRLSRFLSGETTFESKTTPPRVLGTAAGRTAPTNWAEHMTPEETEEAKAAYATIERITKAVKARLNPPKGTREWYELEIAKHQAALEALKGAPAEAEGAKE